MPVSPLPILTWLIILAALLIAGFRGARAFGVAMGLSVLVVVSIWLTISAPGHSLHAKASAGDAAAQFEYARFVENKRGRINSIILWPSKSGVDKGYAWLVESAKQDYPPALYALGVRLKHGIHVPRPANWTGPAGNRFRQPDVGQPYINKAIELGYEPTEEEQRHYWHVFRR